MNEKYVKRIISNIQDGMNLEDSIREVVNSMTEIEIMNFSEKMKFDIKRPVNYLKSQIHLVLKEETLDYLQSDRVNKSRDFYDGCYDSASSAYTAAASISSINAMDDLFGRKGGKKYGR